VGFSSQEFEFGITVVTLGDQLIACTNEARHYLPRRMRAKLDKRFPYKFINRCGTGIPAFFRAQPVSEGDKHSSEYLLPDKHHAWQN
jgi:hypothetical protein